VSFHLTLSIESKPGERMRNLTHLLLRGRQMVGVLACAGYLGRLFSKLETYTLNNRGTVPYRELKYEPTLTATQCDDSNSFTRFLTYPRQKFSLVFPLSPHRMSSERADQMQKSAWAMA
jgi:hypothetical protein